jgi:uncharacterized protein (TIGR03083 family)
VDVDTWIDSLRRDGRRLADAAAGLSPDDRVPTCPAWDVRKLVRHTGWVHRWAGAMVRDARSEPPGREAVLPGGWPADEGLVDWFLDGHRQLVSALESAPDDLECWTFMQAPRARAFWARRQAHETAIHRVDAELVAGAVSGFDTEHASDGIDELLVFFISRPDRGPRAPEVKTLRVVASDAGRHWTVSFGPDESAGHAGGEGPVECTVTGRASDLYLYLWNRIPPENLRIEGRGDVFDYWSEASF